MPLTTLEPVVSNSNVSLAVAREHPDPVGDMEIWLLGVTVREV